MGIGPYKDDEEVGRDPDKTGMLIMLSLVGDSSTKFQQVAQLVSSSLVSKLSLEILLKVYLFLKEHFWCGLIERLWNMMSKLYLFPLL